MKSVIFSMLMAATAVSAINCPSEIPTGTFSLNVAYGGASTPYTFVISPTKAVDQPPAGYASCGVPGYITEYSNGGNCDFSGYAQDASPTVSGDACHYAFTDRNRRVLNLALTCDESATVLQMNPNVIITSEDEAIFSYGFNGSFAGVCGSVPTITTTVPSTPINCPSEIPTGTFSLNVVYGGAPTPYTFVISPTKAVDQPPAGYASCGVPGYITEYSNGGNCDYSGNALWAAPTVNGDACHYAFTDRNRRVLNLALTCDKSATVLQMSPTVVITSQFEEMFYYAFNGSFAGVCGNGVPTTTTAPAPAVTTSTAITITSPSTSINCPRDIPAGTFSLNQVYNGVFSPYIFVISPTKAVNQPPAGYASCGVPGYISQYSNGNCDALVNIQRASPTVTGDACHYSFTYGGVRIFNLAVTCDESAAVLNMNPSVPVTLANGAYNYAFNGSFAGVCGNGVPAMATAPPPALVGLGRRRRQSVKKAEFDVGLLQQS